MQDTLLDVVFLSGKDVVLGGGIQLANFGLFAPRQHVPFSATVDEAGHGRVVDCRHGGEG